MSSKMATIVILKIINLFFCIFVSIQNISESFVSSCKIVRLLKKLYRLFNKILQFCLSLWSFKKLLHFELNKTIFTLTKQFDHHITREYMKYMRKISIWIDKICWAVNMSLRLMFKGKQSIKVVGRRCSVKKVFLEISQKHLCQSLF